MRFRRSRRSRGKRVFGRSRRRSGRRSRGRRRGGAMRIGYRM